MSGDQMLSLARQAIGWVMWAGGLALAVLVVVALASRIGLPLRQSLVPVMAPMDLAALAVAWWCAPKG